MNDTETSLKVVFGIEQAFELSMIRKQAFESNMHLQVVFGVRQHVYFTRPKASTKHRPPRTPGEVRLNYPLPTSGICPLPTFRGRATYVKVFWPMDSIPAGPTTPAAFAPHTV